jgi:hypothetical protein
MKTGTMLGLLALVIALACAATWIYFIRQVDIPENRMAFVVIFLSAAALGVAAFVKGTSWAGAVPAALAIFIGLLLPFTVAISTQELTEKAIEVGDRIPHFTAIDANDELFDSASLHGHLVLIKFFRAHW